MSGHATIGASASSECFVCVLTLLDSFHELAHVDEFITADFIVLVEVNLTDIAFGHFEVTHAQVFEALVWLLYLCL